MNLEELFEFTGLKIEDYSTTIDSNGEATVTFKTRGELSQRGCPMCGSPNAYKHGYTTRNILDLSMFGMKTYLDVEIARYRCQNCGSSFQHDISEYADRNATISNRLREALARESAVTCFTQAAYKYGVSTTTAKESFGKWCERLDEKRQNLILAPEVLGVDEAHLAKKMRGVFVDIQKGTLLEMTQDRNKETVIKTIMAMDGYEKIKVITIDMCSIYKSAIKEIPELDKVRIIIDRFHVIQLLIKRMVKARAEIVTNAGKPKLGDNSIYMRMNMEQLSDKQKEEMSSQFVVVPKLATLYGLKESFRTIYNCKIKDEALQKYSTWCDSIPADKEFNHLRLFKKTVDNWKDEIFNYFDYPITNATTEAVNGLIKKVNRAGNGYRFDVLRKKVQYGLSARYVPTDTVYVEKKVKKHTLGYAQTNGDEYTTITEEKKIIGEYWENELFPNIEELSVAIERGDISFSGNKMDFSDKVVKHLIDGKDC